MSHIDPQESRQHLDVLNDGSSDAGSSVDERTPEQQKADKDLANRLSQLIENANEKLIPLCKMIRKVCLPALRCSAFPLTPHHSTSRTWTPRRRRTAPSPNS